MYETNLIIALRTFVFVQFFYCSISIILNPYLVFLLDIEVYKKVSCRFVL